MPDSICNFLYFPVSDSSQVDSAAWGQDVDVVEVCEGRALSRRQVRIVEHPDLGWDWGPVMAEKLFWWVLFSVFIIQESSNL